VNRAKVFWSGRSQAIRLPKEFRVATDEVSIKRRGNTLILGEYQGSCRMKHYTAMCRELSVRSCSGLSRTVVIGEQLCVTPLQRAGVRVRAAV